VEISDDSFKHIEAIIHSMTPEERRKPSIINTQRKNRIARGAGRKIEDVNQLMKQFEQMGKMMKVMQGPQGKQLNADDGQRNAEYARNGWRIIRKEITDDLC